MLRFSSVSKHFGKVKAVDNLSFSVKKGEIFALLGPNGAGKTTSVRMIMQIMHPDKGNIEFESSVMTSDNKVNRALLGYLPEERGLYQDVSIFKTLLYLASLRSFDKSEAAKKAQMWLERFEIYDRRNEKISSLSKGNQQKVQFIASILHEPKFAILDEPFSGFDPINQEVISDCIRELRDNGMTILLSAHQMQLVERIADRILMLHQGQELLSGTMQEIRNQTVADHKIVVEYSNGFNAQILQNSANIKSFNHNEDKSVDVYMNELENLNGILADISSAGPVSSLKTSEVNLHEIFIQSFTKEEANQ